MSVPATINNGDIPDATKLMAWFLYLNAAGAGIKQDTRANLKLAANNAAGVPFLYVDTTSQTVGMFMGDVTKADNGLVDFGGWS